MSSSPRLEPKQKNSSNPFRIPIFLFLSYSFGINEKYVHHATLARSKTIPDSRTKWAKGPKTIPFGSACTYVAYIREYPPGWDFRNSFFPDGYTVHTMRCTKTQTHRLCDRPWPRRQFWFFFLNLYRLGYFSPLFEGGVFSLKALVFLSLLSFSSPAYLAKISFNQKMAK